MRCCTAISFAGLSDVVFSAVDIPVADRFACSTANEKLAALTVEGDAAFLQPLVEWGEGRGPG